MLTLKGAKGIIRRTADEQRNVSYMDYGTFLRQRVRRKNHPH